MREDGNLCAYVSMQISLIYYHVLVDEYNI